MTPREAIENMINEDGYEVYLDIMHNIPRTNNDWELFSIDTFYSEGGIKMFLDHIEDKITTYKISGLYRHKRKYFEKYLGDLFLAPCEDRLYIHLH